MPPKGWETPLPEHLKHNDKCPHPDWRYFTTGQKVWRRCVACYHLEREE